MIDYADSTPDVTFTYDANDNHTQMTDGQGTETATFDALDRLISQTRSGRTISYGYDLVNLTSRAYPNMPVTSYAYDDDERLSTVTWNTNVVAYRYDAASNLTLTTLPATSRWEEQRGYDRAGRLTAMQTSRLDQRTRVKEILTTYSLTLDPVGNPLTRVRSGTLDGTESYSYDAMDRLMSVCYQAGTCPGASDPFIRYSYDAVGNRLSEARPSATTSYTYNAADELTQAGTTPYSYDRNGNQLSAGQRTFTWDLANRLRTTTLSGVTTTYAYAADGVRLRADSGTSPSQQLAYLWDRSYALPRLAIERDGSGLDRRRYRHGLRPLQVNVSETTVSSFHFDPLGSVTDVTSASPGNLQWSYGFEPYGTQRQEQQYGSGQPVNIVTFAGEQLDPTGLYHLRARQYDTQTGRLLSRDPLAPSLAEPSLSAYAYVGNRPTVFVDPSGRLGEGVLDQMRGMCWLCPTPETPGDLLEMATSEYATTSLGLAAAACALTAGSGCIVLAAAATAATIVASARENVFTECPSGRAFASDVAVLGFTRGLDRAIRPATLAAVRGRALTPLQAFHIRRRGPLAIFAAEQVGTHVGKRPEGTCP